MEVDPYRPGCPRILNHSRNLTCIIQPSINAMNRPADDRTPARDPHRFINDLEPEMIERLVERLESRGKDRVFTRLFDNYSSRLDLQSDAQVLEIGCGTGAVARALARKDDAGIHVTGIDHSPALIRVAYQLADEEGIANRLTFKVGDAHALPYADACFDAVILTP